MARHGKRSRSRQGGKHRKQPTADRTQELPAYPLGVYGQDWDDDFAFIAGFTGWGFAYGVPWHEATWLLEDPEFAEWVREAQGQEREREAGCGPARSIGPAHPDEDDIPF